MKVLKPFVIAFHLLALGACGVDTPRASQPVPAANPTPPLNAPGTSASWTKIYENQNNDMLVVGGKCNWPHQFTLQADGTYFGSCKGGTPPFTGKLTNSEFDELSSRASKVVDADPSQAAVCNDSGAIAGTEIDLTLNNGATYTVFESSPIKKCYRGGTANVSALSDYIGMLMTKYFPKNTGGSTP